MNGVSKMPFVRRAVHPVRDTLRFFKLMRRYRKL
jgi:hypothetical protein